MKTTRLIITILLLSSVLIGQAQYALQTGKFQFNGGIGFSNWGLPLYAGLDYGYDKNISFGGEISARTSGFGYNSTVVGIAGNGNYHFVELLGLDDDFDVYAGLNVGFYTSIAPIRVGAQIGGRYYFKKNMAVNVELGGGNAFSGGKVGLSVLLNQD
jgi:hypothetical protein